MLISDWSSDVCSSDPYATGPGGKGFNQAVACARSGARTTFICALGDDPGGQLARALAADAGIDLRDLHSTEPTGTAGLYVGAAGRNRSVTGAGANPELSARHVDAQPDAFADPGVVLGHLASRTGAIPARRHAPHARAQNVRK